MIQFYSGTPGSGKSLHVAREIEKKLKSGGNVIANFEFAYNLIKHRKNKKLGSFLYLDNLELSYPVRYKETIEDAYGRSKVYDREQSPVQFFYEYAKNFHDIRPDGKVIEHQTLIVFDEAQMLFNSREWQNKYRQDWVKFFTLHRHYGYDVILVSQFDRLLDRQIRGVFEEEINHKKVMNYKTLGAILSIPFGGNLFVAVSHWSGTKGKENVTGRKFFVGRKRYYDYYNSYKMFD